jgi:tetratricopeptide (TPR) repeat protein
VIAIQLCGCAIQRPLLRDAAPLDAPPVVRIAEIPFYPQEEYQCGPAALAMVLQWSGVAALPETLTTMVYLPDRQGSLQLGLIGGARRMGRLAYPIQGPECLLRSLAVGQPVIVLLNLRLDGWPLWHYAVAIGYDLAAREIILHSGTIAERRVGFDTFQRTWQRAEQWGLAVLPPSRLPACAEEEPFIKAALGLQQVDRGAAALEAFRTAAQRWPKSFTTRMALGNALYAQGEAATSVEALRAAVEIDPLAGAAWNNLAHVSAEMGRWDEAESAARRAVELGGSQAELFRATLEDIRRRRPPP